MIMGNCVGKMSLDRNQPLPKPAHPPSGVEAIRSYCCRAQQQNSSSPTKKPKSSKSISCNHCGALRRDRNKNVPSYSRKENDRRYKKPGCSPAIPRNLPFSKVRKWVPARNIHSFRYSVLRTATQRFSDQNLIGEGGFGRVYIGYINLSNMKAAKPDTGKAIAIKMLRQGGPQGDEEFKNEIKFLSILNHPNVVKLMGFCHARKQRILVYDYMCKGSLEAHLLSENNDTELSWSRRIKIAVEAARAVDYLHTHVMPVIHRDLKSSNFLLDADFNPRLSDFGMARYGPVDDQPHVSTRFLGTRGYQAPEYWRTGHLTVKTDAYSFGVVLLEIFTGSVAVKKNIDGTTIELPAWAKPHLSNQMELHNIIDKKIAKSVEIEQAHKFASIIHQCLGSDPKNRPTMGEVLANLEKLQKDMSLSNLNSLGLSKYHRRTHML